MVSSLAWPTQEKFHGDEPSQIVTTGTHDSCVWISTNSTESVALLPYVACDVVNISRGSSIRAHAIIKSWVVASFPVRREAGGQGVAGEEWPAGTGRTQAKSSACKS